jgi:hypothetical protein
MPPNSTTVITVAAKRDLMWILHLRRVTVRYLA